MLLTPATTDLFQKVGLPGSATTLASPGFTIGNTGITVGSTTNHPTDTLYTFAIDRAQTVNGVTSRIAGTYCEFEGIVGSGTTIGSMVLKYGTAQNYPAGSFTRVYIPVSSNRENQLIVGLRQDHNGKGNHQTLTDDNANPWLGRNQVASAVNYPQVTNAATGGIPRVDAIGGDTNIPLYLGAKGNEVAHAENPELTTNFVASGGVVAISSGLIGTFSNMVFYSSGKRYKKTSVANKTYTVSKDTYVDADPTSNGTVTYTEVANGAASPTLTSGYVRIAKVITSGAAITSVVQTDIDSLRNPMRPTGAINASNLDQTSLPGYQSCILKLTTTSIANSAVTLIAFPTSLHDPNTLHSTSVNTSRITILKAGIYTITARGTFGTSTGGTYRILKIYVNGSLAATTTLSKDADGRWDNTAATIEKLAIGDYVEMSIEHNQGSSATVTNISLALTCSTYA